LAYGKVSSIDYASNGVKLDLGLMGSRSLMDIRKIM
jgi:flagellar basal-body rod modification protein FlgD